jgi:hypothetical protein
VLRGLVLQGIKFDDALDWLSRRPMSWRDHLLWKERVFSARLRRWLVEFVSSSMSRSWKEQEEQRIKVQRMEEELFPWEDVEVCRSDSKLQQSHAERESSKPRPGFHHCPRCHRPLTWIWFSSPAWTWEKLCGRAVWLGICESCHLQVEFLLELLS